jgi:hypothetical protein
MLVLHNTILHSAYGIFSGRNPLSYYLPHITISMQASFLLSVARTWLILPVSVSWAVICLTCLQLPLYLYIIYLVAGLLLTALWITQIKPTESNDEVIKKLMNWEFRGKKGSWLTSVITPDEKCLNQDNRPRDRVLTQPPNTKQVLCPPYGHARLLISLFS